MPTQAYPYLAMTDGTTTVTYADGLGGATNYPPLRNGWIPAITALRESELGGVGPYEEVAEEIEHNITGANTAAVLANLAAESRLLDQAERWWRYGEAVSPVLIKYAPQGSTIASTAAPLYAIVLGRALGDETNINLSDRWNDTGMISELRGVRTRFLRRGRWLFTTADTVSVAAAAVPTVMTGTFGVTHNTLSPLKVDFTGAPGLADSTVIIAVTPNSGQAIVEAESGSLGANLTSVADAANSARGGSVARYTAPASPVATSIILTLSGLNSSIRRFTTIMAIRKNTAADVIDLSVSYRRAAGAAVILATSETQRISSSSTNPQLLIFNPVSVRDEANSLIINITPITTAAARTFDIDYVAVVQVDDNASAILTAAWPSLGANETIEVDPTVQEQTPRVQMVDSGTNFPMTYTGNPSRFGVRGSQVQCTLFATGGSTVPTKWRMWDSSGGGSVASLGLSLSRLRGYLTPE